MVVHHGATRASADELAAEATGADIVITTYGTAVRDIEALSDYDWARVVVDEAQSIENPASETAQQLRRIPAGPGWRSPAPPSRTASATCGRCSTS